MSARLARHPRVAHRAHSLPVNLTGRRPATPVLFTRTTGSSPQSLPHLTHARRPYALELSIGRRVGRRSTRLGCCPARPGGRLQGREGQQGIPARVLSCLLSRSAPPRRLRLLHHRSLRLPLRAARVLPLLRLGLLASHLRQQHQLCPAGVPATLLEGLGLSQALVQPRVPSGVSRPHSRVALVSQGSSS